MKKIIKILISLLLVLIVTIIAVPYFFKDEIEKFIKEEINQRVNAKIDYDDVHLSLWRDFPNLHVQIDNINIDGVDEFSQLRLAHIDEFTASLNAKKIFVDKDLEVRKIGVDGADLHFKVLKNGQANYDIVKPDSLANDQTSKEDFVVKIEEYEVSNSNIWYDDETMDLQMKLKNIQHEGTGVFSSADYKLLTRTSVDTLDVIFDGIHYINNAQAVADASILIENDFNTYTIHDMLMSINDLEFSSNMMFDLQGDDIDMKIDYVTRENSLKKLLSLVPKAYMPDLNGVSANGTAKLQGFVKGIYNEHHYPAYGVDFVVNKGSLKYPDLPQSVDDIVVLAKIDFPGGADLDKTRIDLSKVHFSIAGNAADGHLSVRNPMTDPFIDTQFKSKMDLAHIKSALHLPSIKKLSGKLDADVKLKGRSSAIEKQNFDQFEASGYFNLQDMQFASDSLQYEVAIEQANMDIKPQALDLQQFDAKVGESDFHITGKLKNYIAYILQKNQPLKADFKLHSNYLNLNEFMTEEETDAQEKTSDTTGIIKVPKNLEVNFLADADKMKYKDLNLNNVKGHLDIKDEKISMQTVLMKTLGGEMILNGIYDTSKELAETAMDLSMKKLSIAASASQLSMFKTYTPVLKKIQGSMFTDMNLKMALDDQMNPVFSTLDAKGLFKTGSLNIGGIDVMRKIGDMLKINELKKAQIDNIKAQFEIDKGKLFVKPFQFKINQIQSGLQGSVSLDKQLDFVLDMAVPRQLLGTQANQVLENLVGKLGKLGMKTQMADIIKMKFKITGDYNHPKIVPVIAGVEGETAEEVITQAVEQKVEEVVDEAKEKALEEAKKQADKILAEAQIKADLLKAEAHKAGEKLIAEADKQAEVIIKKAGNDPFKKIAAETMATKLRNEAKKNAQKLETEAQQKADLIMKNAREKADRLLNDAEN